MLAGGSRVNFLLAYYTSSQHLFDLGAEVSLLKLIPMLAKSGVSLDATLFLSTQKACQAMALSVSESICVLNIQQCMK
jgi:hypothetical protein